MKFFGFLFNKPEAPKDKDKEKKEKDLSLSSHHSCALENIPNTENTNKSQQLVDSILSVHKVNKTKP